MQTNPYHSPHPVTRPEDLYGRHELVRALVRGLLGGVEVVSQQIVGLSRSGKTSILNSIARLNDRSYTWYAELFLDLHRVQQTLFVQFDCLKVNSPGELWSQLGGQLAEALHAQRGRTSVGLNGSDCHDFEEFADDVARVSAEYDLAIVFLLDEFDKVMETFPLEVAGNLRSLISASVGYVTATHRELVDYYTARASASAYPRQGQEDTPLAMLSSPLHNLFDPKPKFVGLLAMERDHGVEAFIKGPAREAGVVFSPADIEFALRVGGKHPDLTRLACGELFEARLADPSAELAEDALMRRVVRSFTPTVSTLLVDLSGFEDVLLRLARAPSPLDDVPRLLRTKLQDLGLMGEANGPYRLFSETVGELMLELVSARQDRGPDPKHIMVWPDERAVQIGAKLQHLTPTEWRLFSYLYEHAGAICSRESLQQAAYPNQPSEPASPGSATALDITLSRLRQKLPDLITTVRGQGYRLEIPPALVPAR